MASDLSSKPKAYIIREQAVMLDQDLAEYYGVTIKTLRQAVTKNTERFPENLMFKLTREELDSLRLQIVTANLATSNTEASLVFTLNGVLMLAVVLNSPKAIEIHVQSTRVFVAMRHYLMSKNKLEEASEGRLAEPFQEVFDGLYVPEEIISAGIAAV